MDAGTACVCAFFALASLVPFLAACGKPGSTGDVGRGVLVIAIDGLRADHLSCYGYDLPTTPGLDALASDGVRFRQTFSSAPSLLPAHFGLMTGCDPTLARRLHLNDELAASVEERWLVPEKVPHTAVEFLVGGFASAAFVDDPLLGKQFGFGPGFPALSRFEDRTHRGAHWRGGFGGVGSLPSMDAFP